MSVEWKNLCIFDMSSVNARRYNRSLSNLFDNVNCLIDDPNLIEDDGTFKSEVCSAYWSISKLQKYFERNNISLVIISGQRIADHRVTIAAKQSGAVVVYKMHGLYVPHMPRGVLFYVRKALKSFRTLFYCFDMAIQTNRLNLFLNQITNFIFGNRRFQIMKNKLLQPDHAIFWSEYWINWHQKHYHFCPNLEFIISGNPDTINIKTSILDNENTYIYQTLVEDGRIDRETMMQYYLHLKLLAESSNSKIKIKWHPRGDNKIKIELQKMGFDIVDSVTRDSTWFGHYSSLLGLGPLYNNRVIIHELPGHPTPESIQSIANEIIHYSGDLGLKVKDHKISDINLSAAQNNFGDIYDIDKERLFLKNILKNA